MRLAICQTFILFCSFFSGVEFPKLCVEIFCVDDGSVEVESMRRSRCDDDDDKKKRRRRRKK